MAHPPGRHPFRMIPGDSAAGTIGLVDAAMLDAFGLDPDVLHLNHGAFGVAPVVVRRRAAAWRDRAERNPHRFNRVEVSGLVAAARKRAEGFLGVDQDRTGGSETCPREYRPSWGSLELHPADELVISARVRRGPHGAGPSRGARGARIVEAG